MTIKILLKILFLCITLLFSPSLINAQGNNIVTLEQYEEIVEPEIAAAEPILFISPAGIATWPLFKAWQITHKTFMTALKTQVDDALARAITTNTIKDFKIKLKPAFDKGFLLIKKIKKDLEIYEEQYPDFKNLRFPPETAGDPRTETWKKYDAIKSALKKYEYKIKIKKGDINKEETKILENAEETYKKNVEAANKAILDVLRRLSKYNYALTKINNRMKYLEKPLGDFHVTLVGLEHMAMHLFKEGMTPKKQVRAIFQNYSEELSFSIQIATPADDGEFKIRFDTRYPATLGPRPKPKVKYTRRWLPIDPKDKIIIRTMTMGKIRQKILYNRIQGRQIELELSSLSRSPYYLGYKYERGTKIIISRWYPVKESYRWNFSGSWGGDEGMKNKPEIKSTDGKTLRSFVAPLTMSQDRMEWIMPEKWEDLNKFTAEKGYGVTEVTGEAIFEKQGPTMSSKHKKQLPPEKGKGRLLMKLEVW